MIYGIAVKRETTLLNLVGLPFLVTIGTMTGAFINANMPNLLRDPDFFNLPFENVGMASGTVLFWGYLVSMLATPFLGYLFDMMGRLWFLLPACFVLAFTVALIPYSAPSFGLLCFFRTLHACVVQIVMTNPLVIDYVKTESRGLMMSIVSLGLFFGELLMVSIFAWTRDMPIMLQYWTPALVTLLIAVILVFLLREPKIKQDNQNR